MSQRSPLYSEEAYGLFLLKINYFILFNKYIKYKYWCSNIMFITTPVLWDIEIDGFTQFFLSRNYFFNPYIAR